MSLETEVKKLTAAMVQLTDAFNEWRSVDNVKAAGVVAQEPAPMPAPEPPPPPAPPAPTPVPPAPVASEPQYDFKQVNEILGTIAGRMGDQGAAVRQIMAEYNATSLMQIPEDKYGEIITRAQALLP